MAPSYPPAEYNARPSPLSYYLEWSSQVTRECPLGYLLNPVTLILEVQVVAQRQMGVVFNYIHKPHELRNGAFAETNLNEHTDI